MFLCVLTFLLAVAVPLAEGVFTIACTSGRDFKVQLHGCLAPGRFSQATDWLKVLVILVSVGLVWNATQISYVSPELALSSVSVSIRCRGCSCAVGHVGRGGGWWLPWAPPGAGADVALKYSGRLTRSCFGVQAPFIGGDTNVGLMASSCVELWARTLQTRDDSVLCVFHLQLFFLLNCIYVTPKSLKNKNIWGM